MSDYSRYAVYYLPEPGALADFGADWLGWDAQRGTLPQHKAQASCGSAALPDRDQVTATPRKYGFHATLKPPFRLAPGTEADDLHGAVADLARQTAPARAEGLELTRLGRFLALTLRGDDRDVARVAGRCVEALDRFRAPPTEAELARRTAAALTPQQQEMLARWGYPYVFQTFRFHMTLTGKLSADRLEPVAAHLEGVLPPMPAPFVLGSVCLLGERPDTRFELLHRYALSG